MISDNHGYLDPAVLEIFAGVVHIILAGDIVDPDIMSALYLDPGSASAPHEEDDGPTVAIVEVGPAGLAVTFVPRERRDVLGRAQGRYS